MATIGATQLIVGFLGLKESEVDSIQPIPDAKLIKIGRSKLDRTMTGVTYALSMEQGFLIIFDSDYAGQAVAQKTFWGEGTDDVYNMVKKMGCSCESISRVNRLFYLFTTTRLSSC